VSEVSAELDVVAKRWRDRTDALAEPVHPELRWPAEGVPESWPTLHLDDLGAIPFLDNVVGVEGYQLRARVRAQDGDLYVATCPDMPDYERYCREQLQLGAARFVYAEPVGPPISVARAAAHGAACDALVAAAAEAGGLAIHPYMGNRDVWRLAEVVAQRAEVPVKVLAPPPSVMWLANDKLLMTRIGDELRGILGRHPCVPTIASSDPDALVAGLRRLAAEHAQVALKMTRCASAMGNQVFDAERVGQWSDSQARAAVDGFLSDKQWVEGDEVLAVAWLATPLSPSTQMWLSEAPTPRIDGVYEQLLEGPEKVFLGSVPAHLDDDVVQWMVKVSQLVGGVFQRLGYRGRCSFDFIVHEGQPYLVEVNGRWGGTSTPMHLMDRLFPSGRPEYLARDILAEAPEPQAWTFERLAGRLEGHLYDARTGKGSYVLYNVGPLPTHGKFDVIAMGADRPSVREAVARLPALLGA